MSSPLPKTFEAARDRGSFDPLVLAIAQYRIGAAAFNATAGFLTDVEELETLAVSETYEGPMDALREWSTPPTNMAAAIAGLKLGIEELRNGDNEIADSMMTSVLAYLRTLPATA